MSNSIKKHEFLLPFARLFTRHEGEAADSLPPQSRESIGDEDFPALDAPADWSVDSIAVMAEAACPALAADLYAVEENTVPSWLWHHQGQGTGREAEGSVGAIFDRIVGSAAAKAWKLDLFRYEKQARAFYDETRLALTRRIIAIDPEIIAPWGLSWAYGCAEPAAETRQNVPTQAQIANEAIDGLLGKNKNAASPWKKLFTARGKEASSVALRLSDISRDWYSPAANPARAAIDLLALRHNDGSVNIDALKQTARLLTLLLDLQDRPDVTIGLANLTPLLMALGLAYDSDAARAMAASLAALVTAECYATSAELASLRGMSNEFTSNRDAVMRSLRNHRRAAYGDGNDYEKLSVLPTPLPLKNCPDLSLVAEAQRRWDEALQMARAFGLRATQVTDLTPSPTLTLLMSSAAQGIEPMPNLTALQSDPSDMPRLDLHPAVSEALVRLDYPREAIKAVTHHIIGAHSLHKAPAIDHASLRARGLNDTALEKIESYLPCVNSVRLAITPWIIGVEFCKTQLKISARVLQSPRFDLLKQLGFTEIDIAAANIYCYGNGTARSAKSVQLRHRPLFACGSEMSVEARLRMASAVQSFISGDTGFVARLPVTESVTRGTDMVLAAWKDGLKSLTIIFDPALAAAPRAKSAARRIKATSHQPAKAVAPKSRPVGKNAPVHMAKKSASARHKAR